MISFPKTHHMSLNISCWISSYFLKHLKFPLRRTWQTCWIPILIFQVLSCKIRKLFLCYRIHDQTDIFCEKISNSHPCLSPGVSTIFCCHQACLGLSLMTSSQPPKTLFKLFLSHFVDYLPPLRIIYDNSCNLHTYTLNREPAPFAETIFLIDCLHLQDHLLSFGI